MQQSKGDREWRNGTQRKLKNMKTIEADEMLYQRHLIATGALPFGELKQRSLINKRARSADNDPEFSRLIREELPGD